MRTSELSSMRSLMMLSVVLGTSLASAKSHAEPKPFAIRVTRDTVDGCLDKGTISVNGTVLGEAYANHNLKIPPGKYHAHLKYASSRYAAPGPFGSLAKTGDFIVELDPFTVSTGKTWTHILFHAGTKAEHSEGCILLGPALHRMGDGTVMRFLADDSPLAGLRLQFYDGEELPDSTPNKDITVEIIDTIAETIRLTIDTSTPFRVGENRRIVVEAKNLIGSIVPLTGKNISYSSNNPSIVSVDQNGRLSARAAGTALISASIDGKTGTIGVTVSPFFRFEQANYWGHELTTMRNWTDAQSCANACLQNPQCRVASFHNSNAPSGWAHTCVLRSQVGARHTEQPGIVSWIK